MSLSNSRVVIVGGSSGIGFSLAQRLSAEGCRLVLASRSDARLQAANAALGEPADLQVLDAVDESQVRTFFERIGPFDHLISTIKPTFSHAPLLEGATEGARLAFEAKFWGQYYLAKYGAPSLSRQGSLTFTSGIASQRGYPGFSIVAAMNGATESLVRALAAELAPIRVNAVCPGFVEGQLPDPDRERRVRELAPRLPLGRLASKAEVVEAYLYLLNCRYATGSVVTVDGGAVSS